MNKVSTAVYNAWNAACISVGNPFKCVTTVLGNRFRGAVSGSKGILLQCITALKMKTSIYSICCIAPAVYTTISSLLIHRLEKLVGVFCTASGSTKGSLFPAISVA
jgi:hypothetical protein